jgi:hypothetical protein
MSNDPRPLSEVEVDLTVSLVNSMTALEEAFGFPAAEEDAEAFQKLEVVSQVILRQANELAQRFPDVVPGELLTQTASVLVDTVDFPEDAHVDLEPLKEAVQAILHASVIDAQRDINSKSGLN